MEFGNPKPVLSTFLWITMACLIITIAIKYWKPVDCGRIMGLFSGLEGAILLAYSFSDARGTPLQGTFRQRVAQWFKPQRARPIHFSAPLFYGGLLFLALSSIFNALSG